MALSTYNISDLSRNTQHQVALRKEQHGLFETVSIISSRRSSNIPTSTTFRGKRIVAVASALALATILVIVGAALEVFVAHDSARSGNWIVTAAPVGHVLGIVFVLAVLFLATVPCLVWLLGYGLAWSWLKASVDNGQDRPTSYQLGIIVDVLHGVNLSALWSGIKYIHGLNKDKRTSYKPAILRRAVGVVGFVLTLAYSFVVLLIALAASSSSLSFVRLGAYDATWPQLSRQINASACASTSGAVAAGVNLCSLQTATSTPFSDSLPEGLSTLTNNSGVNAVALGDDGTAFIVPASIPRDVAYYGQANGVLATCQSVTSQCVTNTAPGSPLGLSCPTALGFDASYNTTSNAYPFGILDSSGNVLAAPYTVASNPFAFGAVAQSQAYSSAPDTYVGNSGFFTHDNSALNVLTCSATVRSVGYTYFNSSFTVDQSNSSIITDPDIVRGIGAMTAASFLADRIPAALEGVGLNASSPADYANAFARELSRQLIAFTSVLYVPSPPLEVQHVTPILGSKLYLPLLILILAWTALYLLTTLVLGIVAVRATNASPYTLLAAERLRSPFTAVHAAYARNEAQRTWNVEPNKLFSVETGLDRLSVGPTTTSGGGLAFGVTRAAAVRAPKGAPAGVESSASSGAETVRHERERDVEQDGRPSVGGTMYETEDEDFASAEGGEV
ncbi:hypothetical protein HMN09_00120900 [Mycena chlorophos]|uniref:Uncharacterized protein n=1 Tax=Mycena chlorophos TaxID=658473 RepID=A0A8H6TTG7_MYCCL|nr:hypothetical protein HMN09_00120900 [Mycena chlorophos]